MQLSGNIIDYFLAFSGGVLVSFTPCIYPVIPLTISFIAGVNVKGTKLMGFFISVIYVFGIALTYCTLGVFASLTGKFFGQVQNHPLIYLTVSSVLVFFGFVMLDIIPIPMLGVNVQNKVRPKNIWTVLLFGMVSGLVIGPCSTPALVTLLLYVASKENVLRGISLLFVFSYGVGASLILLGTFSGLLVRLPKSGPWLLRVKQFCAAIFFIIAIYFLFKAGGLIFT